MFPGAFSELGSVEFAQTFLLSTLRLCSSVVEDSSASAELSPKVLVQGYVFQDWHETREEQTEPQGETSESSLGIIPSMERGLSGCRLFQIIPSKSQGSVRKGLSCYVQSLTLETTPINTCTHRDGFSTGYALVFHVCNKQVRLQSRESPTALFSASLVSF